MSKPNPADAAVSMARSRVAEHDNRLQNFLYSFSGPSGGSLGSLIYQIDPLTTFDVQFKFYPSLQPQVLKPPKRSVSTGGKASAIDCIKQAASDIGNAIVDAGKEAYNNAKEEFTEFFKGRKATVVNALFADVQTEKSRFSSPQEHTFLEYITRMNYLYAASGTPLQAQLTPYVQRITVPKLKLSEDKAESYVGSFVANTGAVMPDSNNLQMDIVCTKVPLHERIFYPWMREVTMPYWTYVEQPYTTATITIDFKRHTDMQYVFTGCRPTMIEPLQPSQAASDSATRQVTFTFDFMFIKSPKMAVAPGYEFGAKTGLLDLI